MSDMVPEVLNAALDSLFNGLQVVACGSRDDDLLGASLDVSHALLLAGVEAGALQNDIDIQLAPRSILSILDSVDLDLLAIDNDGILGSLDGVLVLTDLAAEGALSGIVLQQVSQHLGAGQVVDSDDLVTLSIKHLTESQTANTTKTIDSNSNSHVNSTS